MNIYIRSQDLDLFKYCTNTQAEALSQLATQKELSSGEVITAKGHTPDSFVILIQGELELVNSTPIGCIFPGEFCGELFYPQPFPCPFTLKAVKPSTVMLLPFDSLTINISTDADLAARIQAAINDSLCLKIIRLTHRRTNG